MISTILVPLDGSALSEAALPYAQALASRTSARLTLVRAAHVRKSLSDGTDQIRAIGEAADYLTHLCDQLTAQGFHVDVGVPFGGSTAGWILEEIDLRHADLVVMATHDRSGPQRWIHGSVAEVVVSHASVPVLVVRAADGLGGAARLARSDQVLVVPLDGSKLAEAAVPVATDLATQLGARVVLLGVVPRPGDRAAAQGSVITSDEYERLTGEAERYLVAVAKSERRGELQLVTCVKTGHAAEEIARLATELAATCIVMSTHGRTGIARAMLGSVAGETTHRSPCAVMLVRPPQQADAEAGVAVTSSEARARGGAGS
jgi:nucleotide-binding universal stress UspA family protein